MYKRQVMAFAQNSVETINKGANFWPDAQYDENVPTIKPVSYTHLDVYKRQAIESPKPDLIQGPTHIPVCRLLIL